MIFDNFCDFALLTNNVQACEQLNAWLGGFESIIKRMTQGNFNWFLHTMLFYHTIRVLEKQDYQANHQNNEEEGSESEGE